MTFPKELRPGWLTPFSAVLFVLAFPPWDIAPFAWICLIPWLLALHRSPSRLAALAQGAWMTFLVAVFGFYWLAYAIHTNGGLPWVAAIPVSLVASPFLEPQFFAFSFFAWALGRKKSSLFRALLFAFIYCGLDYILPKLFAGSLGHALYRQIYLRQVVDLGGIGILTFTLFLTNYSLFLAIGTPGKYTRAAPLLLVFTLIAAISTYGRVRLAEIQSLEAAPQRKVVMGIIQANIGDAMKLASEQGKSDATEEVIQSYLTLSQKALVAKPTPEVLIWPETAFPLVFREPADPKERNYTAPVNAFVAQTKVPILFGGYDVGTDGLYNTLFLLSREGLQAYHKSILLLFGEYLPGLSSFPALRALLPQLANFGQGPGPTTLVLPGKNRGEAGAIQIGALICYEVLFSAFVLELARNGAQVLVNITNDSWFGPWAEPQIHLALATFRAIETRLPLVRATNTGISALVLPDGTITNSSKSNQVEILNLEIPLIKRVQPPVKFLGNWLGRLSFLITSMVAFYLFANKPSEAERLPDR